MRAHPYASLFLCTVLTVSPLAVAPHSAHAQSLASPRITQPVNEASRVTLKGTVYPLANAANDAGVASPDLRVDRIQLMLKRSAQQESALRQRITDMHTPGSANYHKWLTPAQFGQQFGPSDQDIQTIENWVRFHGFEIGKLNPGNGTLEISGTVGQLDDTFHTSIHRYVVAGRQHYANAVDPQIPRALAPVLGGFVSLNNFPVHRLSRLLGKASYDPQTHQAIPQWTQPNGSAPPLNYNLVVSPQDFYVQYDLNPVYSAGTNGSGQTIAIINDSNINLNFVNNFRTLFGLPQNPPQVIIDGADPGIDGINNPDGPNGDSIEAYLDVEWSGAVAPNANIALVIGGDTALENGLILAAERAVYSDIAPIMSISFGACEQALGSDNQFLNSLWQQAAAEGITVLVSSGDTGSAGSDPQGKVCDVPSEPAATFGLAVSGYASTPYDVAVGGTDFYYSDYNNQNLLSQLGTYWNLTPSSTPAASIKGPIPEQPWNDTKLGLNFLQQVNPAITGGGGGASTCGNPTTDPSSGATVTCAPYAKPPWQVGTGVPNDQARDIPDVSLFAADGINDSYYPLCASDGDCQPGATTVQISGVGGTSASAPAMAGIMALVNQKYGPQGQADYVLYPMAKQYPAAFHDVTAGTNAMPCSGSLDCTSGALSGYAATTGYDPASGLGSVDANQLLTNWNSISFTGTSTTLALSSAAFTHGAAVNLTANVTAQGGTPTGNVAVMTDSPTINQQGQTTLTLKSGSATGSINFLPGGTYNVWGQYGGDGTFGASTSSKTQLTVNPESSSIIFNAVTGSASSGFQSVASQQEPYGTQIILDGAVVPTTYYSKCTGSNSQSSTCQNATYGVPTGTVSFTDSSTALNTAVINAEGGAEYTVGSYAVGSHSVAAKYSGDPSYNASSANAINFSVIKATPGVSVTSNANPIPATQTLVLTAIVDSNGFGAAPSGAVTFKNGSTSLGSVSLVSGVNPSTGTTIGIATLSISNLPSGNESVIASYAGDGNYNGAQSTAYALTVNSASGLLPSSVTATASPAGPASPTSAITLAVTVTGQPTPAAPTGTIDFQTSGFDRGTFKLTAGKTAGTAAVTLTLNSQNLFQGANVIILQYSGDNNYQPSSYTLTVNNPLSDFSMVAQDPVVTVAKGGSATATLDLTSLNGFNAAVALNCTAPSGLTCSLGSPSVSLNGTASTTVTISAAAATGSNRQKPFGWFWAGGGAAAACVFLFGLPDRRRRWRSLLGLMVIAILTAGIGCGGGGGGSSSGGNSGGSGSNPGTGNGNGNGNSAASTSTVVVTGTQGAISHNVAITVKVQGS